MSRHPLLPSFALLLMLASSGHAQPAESLPDLTTLQGKLARTTEPLTWVITGDSITQGAKWVGRERSYSELIQERIRWEMKRRRDFFIKPGFRD